MYPELKAKAISNISTINTYKSQLNDINDNISSLSKENRNIKDNLVLLTKSLEVMKVCISKLSEGHINHLSELVNSMLKHIFDDKNYEVEFKLSDVKNGKILDIYLKDIISDDEIIVTDIHENGGGIQTIIGFILQVYFILYFKQEPILFLDEQLSALSSNYIPNLISYMDQLVQKYNFIFVSVIHDDRFTHYMQEQNSMYIKIYNIDNGKITYSEEYNSY